MYQHHIPDRATEALDLYGPMIVADFGAGSGYFAISAAQKISREGRVLAFDIREEPLEVLRSSARTAHLYNIETYRANLEENHGSHLADEGVDRIILAHILFQAHDKSAIIKEALRILKHGGKMLVVEWSTSRLGPRQEHRVSPSTLENTLSSHGFAIEKKLVLGDHYYGVIAQKK